MAQIEGEGYSAKVLIEPQLEETLEPAETWYRCYQECCSPKEVEPLEVEHGLRLEHREVVPAWTIAQYVDVPVVRRDTAKVETEDEEVEVDKLFK